LPPTLEHGVDQVVLAAEAVLHAALGNARRLCDCVNGQRGSALPIDDALGHIQQRFAIDRLLSAHRRPF